MSQKVLEIKEVAKPTPKENEVLVKIHTTAINDYDCCLVRGKPYLYRQMFGIFKPKHHIPGMEIAGLVEDIGPEVQGFKVGYAVFGDTTDYGFGTLAKYICLNEKAVIKKPDELSFEQATSIPHVFAMMKRCLQNFAFKTNLSWWLFILDGLGVSAVNLLTVSWQNWKGPDINPVNCLKDK